MMGPQDGVDHAVRALRHLRDMRGDWRAVFVGDGDAGPAVRHLARELGMVDDVEFLGIVANDSRLSSILATADVCLAPDPKTPLNDVSSMTKIVEYMSMSRAIVSFDLVESRVSAGAAASYAAPNDDVAFAACIDELLDDPVRRRMMGEIGRRRVESELSWSHSERQLLAAYGRALNIARDRTPSSARRRHELTRRSEVESESS
jgi:glycosyltransferase involved in cell wall biosynthesis